MYAISIAMDVNPPGLPPLTRDQVWRGLVMKAEDAVPFVPGMTLCAVRDRWADGLLRDVEYDGHALQERIRFTPPIEVRFERVGTDGDWITNVISDLDDRLILTFTFAVNFAGVAAGSREEWEHGNRMRSAYVAALEGTLHKVRDLVARGELAA